MKRLAKTRIICTLGPASSSAGVLRRMMEAGMDVVRLNFSHGSTEHRQERIKTVRALNKKYRRAVKLLGDLEGFRIRIGSLPAPLPLKKGETLWLSTEQNDRGKQVVYFDYKGGLARIKAGHSVFIDDGNICLKVIGRRDDRLRTEVLIGGTLKEHKGVNIPEARLDFQGLSNRDHANILFALEQRLDFLAQSFVRNREDILAVRRLTDHAPHRPKIIAKIENREGIRNIDEIIEAGDGIMVARGDMGISIPIYEVPIVQKEIIARCNKAGKFVITATQMLESMTENHLPTRAEVSDVANAVLDGTDYVMLSGETAVGQYPAETVKLMDRIIKYTEHHREGKR